MKKYPYYAFPEMVRELDHYLLAAERGKNVHDAYAMVKWAIFGSAFYDYSVGTEFGEEESLSFAWEDFEIALTGHVVPNLTEPLVLLWEALPKENWDTFERILAEARDRATEATDEQVQRRYLPLFTCKPIRRPEQEFNLIPVTCQFGPAPAEFFDLSKINKQKEDEWLNVATESVFGTQN